jgi:porphobilinogen deaminase
MPGKRNKYGLEHGCRTMYGPIQAFVSVTGREDHFLVVLADTRSSKEIENVEADGTLEEAKQYAIKAAARCLRQDVPEWQWGCS